MESLSPFLVLPDAIHVVFFHGQVDVYLLDGFQVYAELFLLMPIVATGSGVRPARPTEVLPRYGEGGGAGLGLAYGGIPAV